MSSAAIMASLLADTKSLNIEVSNLRGWIGALFGPCTLCGGQLGPHADAEVPTLSCGHCGELFLCGAEPELEEPAGDEAPA